MDGCKGKGILYKWQVVVVMSEQQQTQCKSEARCGTEGAEGHVHKQVSHGGRGMAADREPRWWTGVVLVA